MRSAWRRAAPRPARPTSRRQSNIRRTGQRWSDGSCENVPPAWATYHVASPTATRREISFAQRQSGPLMSNPRFTSWSSTPSSSASTTQWHHRQRDPFGIGRAADRIGPLAAQLGAHLLDPPTASTAPARFPADWPSPRARRRRASRRRAARSVRGPARSRSSPRRGQGRCAAGGSSARLSSMSSPRTVPTGSAGTSARRGGFLHHLGRVLAGVAVEAEPLGQQVERGHQEALARIVLVVLRLERREAAALGARRDSPRPPFPWAAW